MKHFDKKNKKVIISTHDKLYPIQGGAALRVFLIAKEFKNRGYEIVLIAPCEKKYLEDIRVYHIPAPRKIRSQILSAIKFNWREFWILLKHIKRSNLLLAHNAIAAPATLILSKIFNKKFVMDITDLHSEYLKIGKIKLLEKMLLPFSLWFEYFVIKHAEKIVVVTQAMKNHLSRMGVNSNKIKVIYDAANVEDFIVEKESGADKNIIHFGLIDRAQGVDVLIKAIPYILKEFPIIKVYIVGGGRELERIISLSKELNVYNVCIFTDYIDYPLAKKYLNKANIGVITRGNFLSNHIVVTLKLFEYWASEVAVVAPELKGISEIGKDMENLCFYKPGDEIDLSNKILYLLKNPEIVKNLKENGFKTVKKFSWKNFIPEIVNFIEYET